MKTILVVEDEREIRKNIVEILDASEFKTIVAKNGVEALELLNENEPDLVISDVLMPVMNGFEFIKKVRENPKFTNVPFIFLTAKADSNSLREGMGYGADDYIFKPFTVEELLEAINLRLKRKEIIDEKFETIQKNVALYIPHELRNPLLTIKGYQDLLINDIESFSKTEIVEMLKSARFSTDLLHETIEKFILFNELVTGSFGEWDKDKEGQKPNSKIDNAIIELIDKKAMASNRKDDLEINLVETNISFSWHLFSFIVIQLLDNAIKFSKKGSKIELTGEISNEDYVFSVKDFGKGLSQQEIAELNSFVQYNREKFQQRGNGLGLSIIKKILNQYDRKLIIESTENQFTKILVHFPIALHSD